MKPVKLEILTEAKGDGFSKTENDLKNLQSVMAVQKQYIADLRSQLASLKGEFSRSTDANAMKPLNATIIELERELKDAELALELLEKSMQENATGSTTLRTQIRNLENDMANMTEGTEEYIRAMERLGQLRDRQGDITQQGRVLADDEKNIRATADAVAGLSGAMSAGVGIASLFGASQEKLQEIQTRLQAVMATTIGIQQVAQTLNKDSYFSIVVLTKAKQNWAKAQDFLNTKLKIGAGASRALMAGGIGLLIAGIGLLITGYKKWAEKQEEINKMRAEGLKSAQEEITKAKTLEGVLKNSNNSYDARKKALDKLKDIMPGYNAQLSTEGTLIRDNTGAMRSYVEQLKNAALAKSAMERVVKAENAYTDWVESLPKESQAALINADMGVSWNDKQDPVQKGLLKKLQDDRKKFEDEVDKWQAELERYTAASILNDNKKTGDLGKSASSTPDNQLAEQRIAAYRKIKEMEISIMEEGEAKRKAQADLEYKNKLAEIAREKADREKHVQELAKAKVPISQEEVDAIGTQAQEQAIIAKRQYEQQIQQIERETANNTKAIQDEIRLNFGSRLNQQLADTDAYYNDLVKKAAGNASLIAQIENARVAAKQNTRDSFALQQLDIEEQIALKRIQIAKKQLQLQTQVEEESLRIQLNAAKTRLEKLHKLQGGGEEVANDIASVTVEIEDLNAKLAEMPAKKMQELSGYVQDILGGLGDFASVFDEDLGKLGDMLSGAVGGAAELGMGIASGNPQQIIQGSLKLLETAGKIIRADKEANEEIRKFNINLAQQAIDYSLAVIRAIKDVKSETDSLFTENYTNTLTQGMAGYNAAIDKQAELMRKLASATVKTGVEKKKFLGITYGTRDVYDHLLKQYPDLLKKDGQLNKELADTLLKSGNLSDETKNLIENIINAGDAAKEAMDAVTGELQNLVGNIGTELKKALDDAFASGTDSGVAMAEKISEKLKEISTAKLYNAVFGSLFADLEQRMKDSYGATGDQNLTDDIDWFMQNYPQLVDKYNAGLSELQKRIKEAYGTDPFAGENGRSSVQKGIAQASQDSIDETNGRLTNMQGSLLVISERTVHIADLLFAIFAPLNRIADNTDRLEAIEKTTKRTTETLEKMERDGINIKR